MGRRGGSFFAPPRIFTGNRRCVGSRWESRLIEESAVLPPHPLPSSPGRNNLAPRSLEVEEERHAIFELGPIWDFLKVIFVGKSMVTEEGIQQVCN